MSYLDPTLGIEISDDELRVTIGLLEVQLAKIERDGRFPEAVEKIHARIAQLEAMLD